MPVIRYKAGYKYQLSHDYLFELPDEFPELNYQGDFIWVSGRTVTLWKGYASDGPSGPTIDTKNFMRGAWQHDGGYQLLRAGIYPKSLHEKLRKALDLQLYRTCLEDGMSRIRAALVYSGVRVGGKNAAEIGSEKRIYEAGSLA